VDGLTILVGDVVVDDFDGVLREELFDLQQIRLLLVRHHYYINSIIINALMLHKHTQHTPAISYPDLPSLTNALPVLAFQNASLFWE
jgi:hypothetical protein